MATEPDGGSDDDDVAPPVVFARAGGAGVLQVTVALHPPGEPAVAAGADMRDVLDEYAAGRGFKGRAANPAMQDRPVALAAGTYAHDELVDRAWCVSADGSIAFFSYTVAEDEVDAKEMAEAEGIVRSIAFAKVEAE